MKIKIAESDLHQIQLQTRLPFRYGIATMTRVPQIFVRLRVEVDGKSSSGISADLLPPKWFTKDPAKGLEEEIQEMQRVIKNALATAKGLEGESAFGLWQQLYKAQLDWAKLNDVPPLLANFGTSLVERALIEAVGRVTGQSLSQMVQSNALGIRPGEIHRELTGRTPADFLPKHPLPRIILRHTVGLADPLTEREIPAAERLNDGLPQSLEASIQAYGLSHFKIKVAGDPASDIQRLRRTAEIIQKFAPPDFAFSLDGNEQFKSLQNFRRLWEEILQDAKLRQFCQHLLFIEQPLHRAVALDQGVSNELQTWASSPPMIIDESDATFNDLPRALELGYCGTSHKNCKGIFKGIINCCWLRHRQSQESARALLLSGEDLCNTGPVALLQDLAVMAALGIRSVERNGHHYNAGLSQFSISVQREVLAHHADLYRPSRDVWPTLRIEHGEVCLDSVNRAPFGVGFTLDVEKFERVL